MASKTVPQSTAELASQLEFLFADVSNSAFTARVLGGMLADAADDLSPNDAASAGQLADRVHAILDALNVQFDRISNLMIKGTHEVRRLEVSAAGAAASNNSMQA